MSTETKKTTKKSALAVLLDRNTKEINKKLSISLAVCSLMMWALILMSTVWPVFEFGKNLKLMIAILGSICTLSPLLLYILKVPDLFLKIYIMISIQVLVTMLGTQNAIGIYITFILVPIASCAYLEPIFNRIVTLVSYISMAISLYFNTAGKLEVVAQGIPHATVFRNYLIGFTIEYIIISLFMDVFLRKAKAITDNQQKLVIDLQSERESYELLLQGSNDILFKYFYDEDSFTASDLLIDRNPDMMQPMAIQPFTGSEELPESIYNIIHEYASEKIMLSETVVEVVPERAHSRKQAAGIDSLYFVVEGRVIYDTEGKADRFIGLIRDVTLNMRDEKRREIEKQTDKLTGMFFYDYMKKYIGSLAECYREGMMLSITVLNFDRIVETYGFIYGDVLLKKIKQILFDKAERPEFCCRLVGAHFLFYKPALDYVDGFQLQQEILEALSKIYVGEKDPNTLKCDVTYGQVNMNNMDEFTHVNRLDYRKSLNQRRTHNLYDLLKLDERGFSRAERERMAECQMFTNSVSDLLRGAKDGESTIKAVMFMLADFYELDRIVVIQGKSNFNQASTILEWNSKPEYALGDYFGTLRQEDTDDIKRIYDNNGYCTIYKDTSENYINSMPNEQLKAFHRRVAVDVLLGAQLWLPITISEGNYTGAWQFDRCNERHYTPIEIFWLSEVVNTIMNYIRRMISDSSNRAKNSFLTVLSHEIRTPMNTIIGLSEILLRGEMTPELKCNLETIHSAGIGMIGAVNDVMDFAKIEAGKIELNESAYDTLALMNEINILLRGRAKEKAIEGVLKINEDMPSSFMGDMNRVKQVIAIMINNAFKFTDTGYVHVNADYEDLGDDQANLVVVIEDSGRGMKPDELSTMFIGFEQPELMNCNFFDGTGLELAVCKKLCDIMQGTIEATSEYEHGATITIKIPQGVVNEKPAGDFEEYVLRNHGNAVIDFTAPRAKVLVADDVEMNLKVFKGLLEPLKLQIDTAPDGLVATRMAEEKEYDIIFLDHMMPEMDGVEAAKVIRTKEGSAKHTPIIALSADGTDEAKQLYVEAGMDCFVPKPIRMKDMLDVLREYLPEEKITGSEVAEETEDEPIVFERFSFNYWRGVEWCGEPELLDSLLGDYYAMIDTKADLIEEIYDKGHIHDFTIEVHSLKSASRMIGAEEMSKRFETLEMLSSNGAFDMIDKILAPTLNMYRGAKEVLKNYARVQKRKTLNISEQGKKDALELLIAAMEEFDTDKVDAMMKSISQYDFTDEQLEKVEKLEAYVADLDSEKTISTAREIIGMLNPA